MYQKTNPKRDYQQYHQDYSKMLDNQNNIQFVMSQSIRKMKIRIILPGKNLQS